MSPRLPSVLVILFALTATAPRAIAELRLAATINNQAAAFTGTDGKRTLLVGSPGVPAPASAIWRLDGEWRDHLDLVRWSPKFSVARADERRASLNPDRPWIASVHIRMLLGSLEGDKPPPSLIQDWPDGLPNGGVAVAAWVLDGAITEVIPVGLPAKSVQESFGIAANFVLTADQAARGQPVLFLWRDGAFVAPRPLYADARAMQALTAVRLDDVPALTRALESGIAADAQSRDGISLIHHAADAGSGQCLAMLLKRKPKLATLPDLDGIVPIQYAVNAERVDATKILIAAKAPVNTRDGDGASTLFSAVRDGNATLVATLLDARATVPQGNPNSPLLDLAIMRGDADIADLLLAAKARFDSGAPGAGRQLLLAAVHGHFAMVRWLVAHGVDANSEFQGATALFLAADGGDDASARALIDVGARVDATSQKGFTPLIAAAVAGNLGYARILLQAGADPRARAADGTTALHAAAQADAAELTELLLERGADINARTQSDLSPLEVALLQNAPAAARALARRDASIALSHAAAEKMLATAIRHDLVEVVEAALREGWPPDSTLAGVWPAVRVAEISASPKCMRALLDAGAHPPDASQPTPVIRPRDLDEDVKVARQGRLTDPRANDADFPETVVRLGLIIDAEGRPLFPKVIEAPDPRLGQAAAESLLNWRFEPPRRQGQPIAVRVQIPLTFPASTRRVFDLDRLSQPPVVIRQVPPEFPADLKGRGVPGRAVIGFVVDAAGKVREVEVVEATHPAFGAVAVEAIRQWEFKPGMIDGRPVNVRMIQPLSFHIN